MWFHAGAHDELWFAAEALQLRDGVNGHQPALVRVEAADLETEMVHPGSGSHRRHGRGVSYSIVVVAEGAKPKPKRRAKARTTPQPTKKS